MSVLLWECLYVWASISVCARVFANVWWLTDCCPYLWLTTTTLHPVSSSPRSGVSCGNRWNIYQSLKYSTLNSFPLNIIYLWWWHKGDLPYVIKILKCICLLKNENFWKYTFNINIFNFHVSPMVLHVKASHSCFSRYEEETNWIQYYEELSTISMYRHFSLDARVLTANTIISCLTD